MFLRHSLAVAAFAVVTATTAHAAVFNLSGSVGAVPTFSITSGALTATFSSPTGNGFAVQSTSGLLDFTPALVDSNFFSADNLTISFSAPVTTQVTIPFAILDAFSTGSDSLSVQSNTGQSATYAATASGLALSEPEGTVSFTPTSGITSLTLSSSIAFAIGNVSTASATSVPEPMSLALVGAGLMGLVASRRRAG